MTKTAKPELMIASWPDTKVQVNDDRYANSCVSFSISLRSILPGDKWYSSDESRAAADLGFYIWCDIDGAVSIDVRAMHIYSATASELEYRAKMLKVLHRKAERADFTFHHFHRDASVYEQLVRCMDALGIRRTVEYRGIGVDETYAPVAIPLQRIAAAIDNQLAVQRQRKAA